MARPGPSKLTSKSGDPLVIRERSIREQFHSIQVKNYEGEVETTKIRVNKDFFTAFNSLVYEISFMCVENAANNERFKVMPSDVEDVKKKLFGETEDEEELLPEDDRE